MCSGYKPYRLIGQVSGWGTRDGGGWLRENLILGQIGNSSIALVVYKAEPAVGSHQRVLFAAAAAAAFGPGPRQLR